MARVYIESVTPRNLEKKIEAIFSAHDLGMRGKTVLVKPNMLGPFPGDSGVITHPEVISAVVKSCLARGAEVMVGDNPGGVSKGTAAVGEATGLAAASRGCFIPINRRVKRVKLPSNRISEVLISAIVLEVDLIINVPVFKTHVLTGLTGAIKNTFGYVAGAYKSKMHLKAPSGKLFAALLCDLFAIRPPDFHIVDALTAMEGNGPSFGRVRKLGKIIAGADPVAVDATIARMMGFNPAELPLLRIAARRGFGTLKAEEIEYVGETPVVIPDFELPLSFQPRQPKKGEKGGRTSRATSPEEQTEAAIIVRRSTLKPFLAHPDLCVRCGECAVNCPPRAIKLKPYPRIGRGCISCFCCVELCPKGALEVNESRGQ